MPKLSFAENDNEIIEMLEDIFLRKQEDIRIRR
jgi:hypothetical protein